MMTFAVTAGVVLFVGLLVLWLTVRYIPNDRVGIVEKLWSGAGSLREGAVIAQRGEAGYQAEILRGGLHVGLWRWQYKIHKFPLVMIKQGKIGYVFSRGGDQLLPSQTLARIVDCNNFQDARKFLAADGQKGRQRGILREGVYAINIALLLVFCLYPSIISVSTKKRGGRWLPCRRSAMCGSRPHNKSKETRYVAN